MRKLLFFTFVALFFLGCSSNDEMPCFTCDYNIVQSSSSSSFFSSSSVVYVDSVYYGGETYKTVVIGTQIWLARNLNYAPGIGNYRCYDCIEYGRLYDWSTAMGLQSSCNSSSCSSQISAKHRGICPPSWHIPSDEEWYILMDAVGDSSTAGMYLKSTSGWNGKNGNGIDKYGFAALPGGGGYSDGYFSNAGNYGSWWVSSEVSDERAYSWLMDYKYEDVRKNYGYKLSLLSVRCLHD